MAKRSAISFVLKASYALLNLLLLTVISRNLGPESYGSYVFLLAIVGMICAFVDGGVSRVVIRETANYASQGRPDQIHFILRWAYRAVSRLCIAAAVLAALCLIPLLAEVSQDQLLCYCFGLCVLPLLAFNKLREGALLGLQRVILGQLPESIVRPLINLVLLGIFLKISAGLTEALVMLSLLTSTGISFIVGNCFLLASLPAKSSTNATTVSTEPSLQSSWSRSSRHFALATGLFVINQQVDISMLKFLIGNEGVGIYKIAISLSSLLHFCAGAIYKVYQPEIARALACESRAEVQARISQNTRYVLLPAAAAGLTIVFFRKPLILALFGAAYLDAETPLSILILGFLGILSLGDAGVILCMDGQEHAVSRASGVALVLNVALNLILAPFFGIAGVAFATIASKTAISIQLSFTLWRTRGLRSWIQVRNTR